MYSRIDLMSNMRTDNIQRSKRLKRIDWNTVQKIIVFLHWNSAKKNHVALHCGMNYDYCDRYLDWCRRMRLITFSTRYDNETISLTERGRELYRDEFEGGIETFDVTKLD